MYKCGLNFIICYSIESNVDNIPIVYYLLSLLSWTNISIDLLVRSQKYTLWKKVLRFDINYVSIVIYTPKCGGEAILLKLDDHTMALKKYGNRTLDKDNMLFCGKY